MSKRKPSSPYKNPPSPFVRAITESGWRRCDAEAIYAIYVIVREAPHADPQRLRTLAVQAMNGLRRDPVLGGALLWIAPLPAALPALSLLMEQAPPEPAAFGLWRL